MPEQALNHFQRPVGLTAGNARNFDVRGCVYITAVAGAGATVTVSRIDNMGEEAHGAGPYEVGTVAASQLESFPVDWPFVRVSVAGGAALVAVG